MVAGGVEVGREELGLRGEGVGGGSGVGRSVSGLHEGSELDSLLHISRLRHLLVHRGEANVVACDERGG